MQNLVDTLLNGPARYTQSYHLSDGWTIAVVIGALLLEFGAVYILILLLVKLAQYSRTIVSFILRRMGVGEKEPDYSFLQLTFPAVTTKSAYATEQLHILMRSMIKYDGFWDRLAARKQPYALEIVATKDEGIRYIISIPKREMETVKRTLISFLPGLKVAEVDDYLPDTTIFPTSIAELKLANDYILSLGTQKVLDEHDPIAYLTGHMRNVPKDALVSFQIVSVPLFNNTHPNEQRHLRNAAHRITLGKELGPKLTKYKINMPRILLRIIFAPFWLIFIAAKIITGIVYAMSTNDIPEDWKSTKKRTPTNPYEKELASTVKTKIDQQLFEVSIRVLVASPDGSDNSARHNAIVSSFNTFSSTYQHMTTRTFLPFTMFVKRPIARFYNRALTCHIVSQQTIVSSSELSDLYHFPNTNLTKTEGLVKSRSSELSAPLSIKRSDAKLDVVVGANSFGGENHDIGMTLEQRQKHTYIIGKTGTGKTTLLKSSIYQDMVSGKGLAVLDPHGDMFRELLSIVPRSRHKDVVVFDPSDRDFPVGLNILDPGIEFASEDDKHDWITSAVLSVFRKLSEESQWGPRMEHILRNTTLTALQTSKPSLYTLQRLLTDKKYQKEVAKELKDPVLKQFWEKEFKMMGSMQMSAATAPLTHRLGHFITSKMSRHILLQEETTVRIADIMNEGKILLVNLSKGDIGEDQSEFFGTILTAMIWMAAYQRTRIPEKKRRDFFVYVDEFQNFATPQFGAITSEGRKFHVSLIVSHQNIAQMKDKDLVKVIAGNAATIICLKANPEDEDSILPYMKPEVEKGDIINLAPYHFYMKVSGDESEDAFSGQTVPLDATESENTRDAVIKYSRKHYTVPKADVEKHLLTLFAEQALDSLQAASVKKAAGSNKPNKTQTELHDV